MSTAIVQTLPDGQPRLVSTELAGVVPVLVSPVGAGGYTAPADAVPAPPAILGGVRIAGAATPGGEVRVELGGMTGVPLPAMRVAWLLNGRELAGVTGATLRITSQMRGAALAVRVELTNRHGTARQTSEPVAIAGIQPVVPTVPLPVALTATIGPAGARVGDAVSLQLLVATNVDLAAVAYAWKADGEEVGAAPAALQTDGFVSGTEIVLEITAAELADPVLSNAIVLAAVAVTHEGDAVTVGGAPVTI